MRRSAPIQYTAVVVVAVFALAIVLSGDQVEVGWLRFTSLAVLVATGVLALWDFALWRSGLAQRLPSTPPVLRGTWKGVLASGWIDPMTKKQPPPKDCFFVIKQTGADIVVTLLTAESKSISSLARLTRSSAGDWNLSYMYLNEPKVGLQHRSRIHHGSTSLELHGRRPVHRLAGRYWTDRESKGQLEFSAHASKLVDNFLDATTLFPESSPAPPSGD